MRVWRVHSSHLSHSRPVLISSQISQRHVGKSVPRQRKWECLECLPSLSTILARECECLHSCVLCLVHISPHVSTSTRDENVNQALQACETVHSIIHITNASNQQTFRQWVGSGTSALYTVTPCHNAKFLITHHHWQYLWLERIEFFLMIDSSGLVEILAVLITYIKLI